MTLHDTNQLKIKIMNKEQFLAMSLPFNLYAFVRYLENGIEVSRKIKPITGYSIEKSVICGYFAKAGFFKDDEFRSEENLLPILHPLSDLTKSIEYKGEKFVPIVELAKTCYNNTFNIYPEIKTFEALNSNNEESFGFIGHTEDERFSLTFDNTFNNQSFEFWIDGSEYYIKQLDLFLRLIELHFDIAGLIEKGEAIDVNTLPENPYK